MSDFNQDEYLDYLLVNVKTLTNETINLMINECDEKIKEHEATYSSVYDDYEKDNIRFSKAWEKYKQGLRKTKPYKMKIDWQYVKQQHKTWTTYWTNKKAILAKELLQRTKQ